jgi:hypothetical protein
LIITGTVIYHEHIVLPIFGLDKDTLLMTMEYSTCNSNVTRFEETFSDSDEEFKNSDIAKFNIMTISSQ